MASSRAKQGGMEVSLEPLITCKLCLAEYTLQDMYRLQMCRCVFCEECIKQYLTIMIREGNVLSLTCPDAACKFSELFRDSEVEHLVDQGTYNRYKRLKFEREVDLDPNRTFCPEAGCETVCHVCNYVPEDFARTIAEPVNCPKCTLKFCSMCKSKWHPGMSCDDVLQNLNLEETGLTDDANIKRCPVCHVLIERDEGCAQMMCKRCKHVFCWYCLESLDDDFLLRHYDKGPCKNKLGHSRASIIWHRTQVVGIFAGFGLLLLVASPLLLLAAPCILCCKCKLCNCWPNGDNNS